ncbi:DUF2069 domain-containing protein [Burkholderia plantarii]|uniref:Transmembrane protein n=1 Tax=Burkholderia plantarii TaxID=41899 RepID=A0A0B6RRQ2_BURPL|nr:DUF2069 domain-containing protein [Burkholderia plantarii]AJK46068.1 hypothetical protein BGL_1c15520 [Burkholderia plantarii]ALK30335.1 transmembrane protein [Burkholderia plantarii]WLE59031.1 DUF2069 domain-containing protein [Burkholderia plantarii]GLZ18447.1 hypothetical protein Bpla01_19770 [Burkholderia plantarii]
MNAPAAARAGYARLALGCLVALIALSLAWELWLAPLRPGGSALMLKAVPLALMVPGVWRRSVYTLQWASMLILLYFAEGVVRGMTDGGLSARLGWLECLLALGFFAAALACVAPFKRAARQAKAAGRMAEAAPAPSPRATRAGRSVTEPAAPRHGKPAEARRGKRAPRRPS